MTKPLLILPVENQVRELDARLLLSLLAAQRDYQSIIGLKSKVDLLVGRFRRGIYLAKALTDRNTKLFTILRELGHTIVATDEEALVHYPPEIYYRRRIGVNAINLVDQFIAWGEDNRRLWENCPGFDNHERIKVLGNPRIDLLRPEMAGYFEPEVERLRSEHGDFILVNSNFGTVNCYDARFNLFRAENGKLVPGRGSAGMPRAYAEGLFDYRTRVLDAFRELVPKLAAAFPETRIVVRPHPAEDHADWRKRLSGHPNVAVIGEGNVVAWLRACRCLIHNGCTTAVEGYVLGTRMIAYVPLEDERYEFELPNRFCRRAGESDAVIDAVRAIAEGATTRDPSMPAIAAASIAALQGPLASERILDLIGSFRVGPKLPSLDIRLGRRMKLEVQRIRKILNRWSDLNRDKAGFARHRFPELTAREIQERLASMATALGRPADVRVRAHSQDVFAIYR